MGESMCLCGEKITDIRAEQTEIDLATKTEWRCQSCGARGRYERSKWPVAKEPDSVRLDEICDRLIDALMVPSERSRVKVLVDCLVPLRTIGAWFNDEMLWRRDYKRFESSYRNADDILLGKAPFLTTVAHMAGG